MKQEYSHERFTQWRKVKQSHETRIDPSDLLHLKSNSVLRQVPALNRKISALKRPFAWPGSNWILMRPTMTNIQHWNATKNYQQLQYPKWSFQNLTKFCSESWISFCNLGWQKQYFKFKPNPFKFLVELKSLKWKPCLSFILQ